MLDAGANPQPEPLDSQARPLLTPERWQQIKEAFGAVLECEPDARDACLRRVCGEDESLCAEVRSLLLAADSQGAATAEVFPAISGPTSKPPSAEEADPMLGRR